MQKINRNDACPCGSGKKHKKCCINNIEGEMPFSFSDFKPSLPKLSENDVKFLKQYDPVELLKILGLLQVLPQNHGKNIRLEALISRIVNDIKGNNDQQNYSSDYGSLLKGLTTKCEKHPFEDPAEEFLTDNIVFLNGNNVVYPGIFTDSAAIVQRGLYTLLYDEIFRSGLSKRLPKLYCSYYIFMTKWL